MVAAPRAAAEPAWGSESAIETYLAGQMRDLRIVGLQVSIVRDGVVSFDRGFGSADGAGRLVDKHTVFSLGSVSKQFTGLAIQRLVATGKLDLDTTVHSIFPPIRDRNRRALQDHRSAVAVTNVRIRHCQRPRRLGREPAAG